MNCDAHTSYLRVQLICAFLPRVIILHIRSDQIAFRYDRRLGEIGLETVLVREAHGLGENYFGGLPYGIDLLLEAFLELKEALNKDLVG